MTDPAIVQDGASSVGLGDAGKRVMEQYGLEKEISKAEKAQSVAKMAGEAQIMSQYGSVLSKPYEEFKPSQESASGFAALGSLLMVAGGMMGGKGRLAGIGAMNNIAGMMKGYQQGRKDLYEQERTQFEDNMKVFEKNRTLIKEAFDRALKMAPYNLTTAQNNLRKELAGLGASIPAEMTAKSGLVQSAGQHDTFHTNTTNTLEKLKEQLGRSRAEASAQAADLKAQEDKYKLEKERREAGKPEGGLTPGEALRDKNMRIMADKIVAEKRAPANAAEQEALDIYGPKDYKAEPILDVGPFAKTMISNQSLEDQKVTKEFLAGKKTLDAKERDLLDNAKVMIDDSERVARYIAENPDATGMLGQALGRSESVLGFFRGPPKTMDELQSKIDNGLDQIAKSDPSQRATAQKAAVLNKMLAALSLKDASATGRPTVFLERMISRWYNQGYPPDTLIDIIKERSGEADSVLSNYKLDTSRNTPDVNKQMYPLASSSVDDFLKQYRKASAGAGLNELSSAQKTGIQERIDQVNNDTSLTAANKKDLKEKIKKRIADGKFSDSGLSWGD